MISKIDYCCSILADISGHLLSRLQSVLNAAARLIFLARKLEHITPLLRELHWLLVPERIQFRLCVLAYRCLHGTVPPYLADSLHRSTDTAGRRRLRSSITNAGDRADEPFNSWTPRISSGCIASMEWPTPVSQDCSVLDVTPPAAQDVPVPQQLLLTLISWPLKALTFPTPYLAHL